MGSRNKHLPPPLFPYINNHWNNEFLFCLRYSYYLQGADVGHLKVLMDVGHKKIPYVYWRGGNEVLIWRQAAVDLRNDNNYQVSNRITFSIIRFISNRHIQRFSYLCHWFWNDIPWITLHPIFSQPQRNLKAWNLKKNAEHRDAKNDGIEGGPAIITMLIKIWTTRLCPVFACRDEMMTSSTHNAIK